MNEEEKAHLEIILDNVVQNWSNMMKELTEILTVTPSQTLMKAFWESHIGIIDLLSLIRGDKDGMFKRSKELSLLCLNSILKVSKEDELG